MRETWVRSLGQEDSPGEGNVTTLQCSCLEKSMDREGWRAAAHGVSKTQTQLNTRSIWQCKYLRSLSRIYFLHCCCSVTSVVSDSVRPHRRQPTRLPRPWDSPGKDAGVGCSFLLQCMKVKVKSLSRVRRLLCPWDLPGKSARVGCHCLCREPKLRPNKEK